MSSIDERVVEAKFDNKQFQSGVNDTLNSLDNLKRGLNMEGAARSMGELENATGRVKRSIDVMRIAAYTAIATIAHQATIAGERIVKAFTIGPLLDGLREYETQLNSVQTIMSNTGWEHKSLEEVNTALDELNHYSDKTIYNFSEMARNVGTFTAAGVKLDTSVSAIKGIANLAAVSGSNAQQASTAMYQLSQALAAGSVKLMDWNSVVNAGMGGKVFQDALKETARVHGVAIDKMVKEQGSFRNTLQEGWLSSKILTDTLNKFAGEQSREQLKQQGYTEKQIDDIIKLGKMATDAATKVKTATQLWGTLKEAAGSGWAQTWETVIGDFEEAKKLWTGVNDVLGGAIQKNAEARNKMLAEWKKLGGRDELLAGIRAGFEALMSILKPIKDAFREIFPKKTAEDLLAMTASFRSFMENLKIGEETADKIKRAFAGFFAILHIGWMLIKAGASFLGDLLGAIGGTSKGLLDFVASIGDLLVGLDKSIEKGEGFTKFFDGLGHIFTPIITFLGYTRITILDILNGIAMGFKVTFGILPEMLSKVMGKVHEFTNNFGNAFEFENVLQVFNAGLFAGLLLLVRKFIKHLQDRRSSGALQTFVAKITEPFHELTETLKAMQKAIMATTILQIAIAVGILTASVIALSFIDTAKLAKALGAITIMFTQLVGGLWLFNKVGGGKGLFATSAGLILFATALRVLTSSVKALSTLGWEELAKGLVGVTALIGGLILATKGMQGNTEGMIRAGAGLLLLAAAIKLLASAVSDFAELSWGDIAKGLVGVGAMLVGLTLFTKFAKADATGISQGAGLVLLAAGIKILASAATDFAKLSWGEIVKGLVAIGAILAGFVLFSKGIGKPGTLLAAGASLIMISGAMVVLAKAMEMFGNLSWGEIVKGLVSMAGALTIIVIALGALGKMKGSMMSGAAALLVVSTALVILSKALTVMGGMSWGEIAKGLVTLAGALTVISFALILMQGTLSGAAALFVVAAALVPLTAVLKVLGSMSLWDIIKALGALAGALIIIGGAALILTEAIPSLIGLAGGIALLGLGLALVGGAVYLFATGLQILALAASGAIAAIKLLLDGVIELAPKLVQAVATIVVSLAKAIAEAAPEIQTTAIILLDGFIFAINREGPKIIRTFLRMILTLLDALADATPKAARSVLRMLVGILNAIRDKTPQIVSAISGIVVRWLNELANHVGDMVTAATNLLIAFIRGVGANANRVVDAGTDVIISFIQGLASNALEIANAAMDVVIDFINGLADAIDSHMDELHEAGKNLAFAVADGMTFGLASKAGSVVKGFTGLAGKGLGAVGGVLGIGGPSKEMCKLGKYAAEGFANGLVGSSDKVDAAWTKMHDKLRLAIDTSKQKLDEYNSKMKELKEHPTKNAEAIKKLADKIAETTDELNRSKSALDLMNDGLKKQHDHLDRLGKKYDENTIKLQKANDALREAKRVRDDYERSIVDQYNTSPDIQADTQLSDYLEEKKKEVVDTQSFIEVLAKLREMGLKDAAYKELLAKGPEALPFAEQILAGGKESINELNDLNSELRAEAKALAATASKELYQAGVNSAQGLVDGLRKKRKAIADEMEHIARILVRKLREELQIKSPSEVFDELGQFTGKGLAVGLKKSVPHIQKATQHVGKNTVESMKQAIRDMNDAIAVDPNMNPIIKPVLDLSAVRQQARGLGHILGTNTAYLKAVNASAGYEANIEAMAPGDIPQEASGDINYVQNNYSPKALSTADIYRGTKNQLSRAKGALKPSAAPVI